MKGPMVSTADDLNTIAALHKNRNSCRDTVWDLRSAGGRHGDVGFREAESGVHGEGCRRREATAHPINVPKSEPKSGGAREAGRRRKTK